MPGVGCTHLLIVPPNMANTCKRISLFILLFTGIQQLSTAQSHSISVVDTLIDYFNSNSSHKDGYDFAGHIVNIPSNTIQKCDNKLTKIICRATGYKIPRNVVDENHDTIIYQERGDDYFLSDSEKTERKKYWVGTSLEILTISVWNDKKCTWEIIYDKK
jgi:hypothetical protein